MKRRLFLTLMLVAELGTGCSNQSNQDEKDWSKLFLKDLKAARQIIKDNHPGAIDNQNPDFNVWLNEGYDKAKKLAPNIKDGRDYRYALASYDAGFRDGHLIIAPDMQDGVRIGFEDEIPVRRWPGFLTAWRNDKHIIAHTTPAMENLLGAIVESCDGKPAQQITGRQIFDFGLNPDIPAHWVNAVVYTFTDNGNSLISLPGNCLLEMPDGTELNHEMIWRPFQEQRLSPAFREIGFSRPDAPGTEWMAENLLWVSIPHFQPIGELVDTYKTMQKEIADNRGKLGTIVFDLRGNGGGSSFWGDRFAESVWGKDVKDALQNSFPSGYVEWRVTPINIEKMEIFLADEIENNGETSEGAIWAGKVIDGMQAALARGDAMWQEEEPEKSTPLPPDVRRKILDGPKVVALTDGYCSSSCLNFMDLLMASPATVHMGYETSADTQYMDITSKKLPSGLMSVIFPVKVYRGRRRPDGGYYTPSFRYDGPWNTEAVQAWTLNKLAE